MSTTTKNFWSRTWDAVVRVSNAIDYDHTEHTDDRLQRLAAQVAQLEERIALLESPSGGAVVSVVSGGKGS